MRYVHPNEYFECQNDMVTCSHCDEKFSVKRGKIYPNYGSTGCGVFKVGIQN